MQKFLRIFIVSIFMCMPVISHAATLYFDPVHSTVSIGKVGSVSLLLNPEQESINAVSATLAYPEDSIEILTISIAGSILPLWIDEPKFTEGTIYFSGIIPNGFDGLREAYVSERKSGILITITYRGIADGSEALKIQDATILLNDGHATEALFSTVPGSITVSSAASSGGDGEMESDTTLPERFTAYVTRYTAFDGAPWVALFFTTDKGTGVAYYEVAEAKKGTAASELRWKKAHSPYILKDQKQEMEIHVRAVDGAGNIRIAEKVAITETSEEPRLSFDSATDMLGIVPLVLILVVVFILLYAYMRRRS